MAPMTRRRSARLASVSKIPTGSSTVVPGLASLAEGDEAALEQHDSPSRMNAQPRTPRTPASSSPAKPSMSEMHPSKPHATTGTPSSALRLGFADIQSVQLGSPTTANSNKAAKAAKAAKAGSMASAFEEDDGAAGRETTPSKKKTSGGPPTSAFTFRFTRQSSAGPTGADLGLSDEARQMMEELREEASKIRADLEVQREQDRAEAEAAGELDVHGRRIAKPKGRAGRYSAAHMAEFKKMDSIANHPSAFRAGPARRTPLKETAAPMAHTRGLKRSQSKANLDDTPNSSEALTRSAKSGSSVTTTRTQQHHHGSNNSSSNNNNNNNNNNNRTAVPGSAVKSGVSAVKRVKQHLHDDASSGRPISRDGSFLPRPATSSGKTLPTANSSAVRSTVSRSNGLASLLTPTKASLARIAGQHQSPAKSSLPVAGPTLRHAQTPAPAPTRVMKPLPRLPVTTPRRKPSQPATVFTPMTQRAVLAERSPSLFRSALPQSISKSCLRQPGTASAATTRRRVAFEGALETSPSARHAGSRRVEYPDLSKHHLLVNADQPDEDEDETEDVAGDDKALPPLPTVPGTFTFRSDKTISFGAMSPKGFGSSPGQTSLRHVRSSTAPTETSTQSPMRASARAATRASTRASSASKMPGSFPEAGANDLLSALVATDGPNKENTQPIPLSIPHGITNKKRHRISEAEEEAEQEALDRAAKKRKNEPVPEGEALMAPRLVASGGTGSITSTPQKKYRQQSAFASRVADKTPASAKKRPVLSLSRLNSLARPKLRK